MPRFIQRLYPERVWALSRKENAVYLTFDDGPIPEVTPWVLDELKKHNAKATFFCIGENVKKHPEIFKRILAEGHAVGNHTFNHLNGWQTETSEYVENVEKAGRQMADDGRQITDDGRQITDDGRSMTVDGRQMTEDGRSMTEDEIFNSEFSPDTSGQNSELLFRPPYGKITSKQARILQKKGFKIVMWDILSYDFDTTISPEKCLQNVLKNTKPGSIVIFHDSMKAKENLYYALPKTLAYFKEKAHNFKSLN